MITPTLPPPDTMYQAFLQRDASYDGLFVVGVRTTGIFCRPSCPARRPARENVEFHASPREALFAGFRACLRCRPLEKPGATPRWLTPLLGDIDAEPGRRWSDADLRRRGLDPSTVRRWFQRHHGMTFHAYQRARRVGRAIASLKQGSSVTHTAFDNGYESLSAFYDAFRHITGTTPARGRDVAHLTCTRIATPLGAMLAAADDDALVLLEFVDRRMLETQVQRITRALHCTLVPGTTPVLEQTQRELDEYFAGTRREFTVPVRTPGSAFQQQVWQELRGIPYATTRSYAQQAAGIGRPEAVRAVARANGDNRIAIVIPCHRVIGADGRLTGYGGGLWRKQWLLDHEAGRERQTELRV